MTAYYTAYQQYSSAGFERQLRWTEYANGLYARPTSASTACLRKKSHGSSSI